MTNYIPITYHKLSRNIESISSFLKSIKFNKHTMMFFSKDCYGFIKNNCTLIGKRLQPFCAKNYMQYNSDKNVREYFSLIPIYSGEWVYLSDLTSSNISINSDLAYNVPKEIKFVYFEDEFIEKDVQSKLIHSNSRECPVDCIMNDVKQFDNSILLLSKENFEKLRPNTDIISYYEGVYRLIWNYDGDYLGGLITLKNIDGEKYYLIESMNFLFCNKTFSVKGLPDSVYFIV